MRVMLVMICLFLTGMSVYAVDAPATDPVAPRLTEYGNLLEASNSANWGGGKWEGARYDLAFLVKKGGELDAFWTHWRTAAPGYGGGDLGTWNFELHADNPAGHTPADAVISKLTDVKNPPEGYFRLDMPNVKLEAGKVYHMVMYNTDPDPRTNWSSPNMIRSRIDDPWQGEGAMTLNGKTWVPVKSNDAQQLTMYGGYARASYCLEFTDGTKEGQPYYSASRRFIYGTLFEGELIPWKSLDTRIVEVGFSVFTVGKPAGDLTFTLEDRDGNRLATGKLGSPDTVKTTPEWMRVKLETPVILQKDKIYRLYLAAPDCKDEQNCYAAYVPYSSEKVPGWPEATWGGRGGRFTSFKDGAWQLEGSIPMDLSFSLRGEEVKKEEVKPVEGK